MVLCQLLMVLIIIKKKNKVAELEKGQLTVAQLIEELKKMPQDAPVMHEGCDCWGVANGVNLEKDGTVLITRIN